MEPPSSPCKCQVERASQDGKPAPGEGLVSARASVAPLRSVLYVSRRLATVPDTTAAIADLVEASTASSGHLAITGALIVTGTRCAQVLEGERPAVEEMMSRIRRDVRREDLSVALDGEITERRFAGWSVAYWGNAGYVRRLLEPLDRSDPPPTAEDCRRVIRFMQGMAAP